MEFPIFLVLVFIAFQINEIKTLLKENDLKDVPAKVDQQSDAPTVNRRKR